MTEQVTRPGENAYADGSFFADVLTQPQKLRDTLLALYSSETTGLLAERFMYGSDWEMLLTQKDADTFFERFIDLMGEVESRQNRRVRGYGVSDAFFGWNAVEYLGLKQGEPNRTRLENFYSKRRIDKPQWMVKVDK